MALTKLTKGRARWQTFKLKAAKAVSRALYDKLLDQGISVKDFGAKGDGVTDDTVALQSAIDYLDKNRGVFTVLRFPAGEYLISDTLKGNTSAVSITYAVHLMGENSCIGGNSSKDEAKIIMSSASTVRSMLEVDSGFSMENLSFDFPNARSKSSINDVYNTVVCDNFDSVVDVDAIIKNCAFSNFHRAIAANGRGMKVEGCLFVLGSSAETEPACIDLDLKGKSGKFLAGRYVDQCYTEAFRVFEVRGCRVHAVNNGTLVRNRGADKKVIKGVHIVSNYIDTSCSFYRGTARDINISSNTQLNCGTTSVMQTYIDEEVENVVISGNVISGIRQESLGQPLDGGTVTQSMIDSQSPTYMVATSGSVKNLVVNGNSFSNSTRDVFLFTGDVDGAIITDNAFRDVCRDLLKGAGKRRNVITAEGGVIKGLVFDKNVVSKSAANTGGWSLWIMQSPETGSVFEIGDNVLGEGIIYGDWSYESYSFGKELGYSSCGYYTGKGGDTDHIKYSGTRKGKAITVYQLTGSGAGKTLTVPSGYGTSIDVRYNDGVQLLCRLEWNEEGAEYAYVIHY